MKILMTGATGFVGKYVLEGLTEKYGRENIIILTGGKVDGYQTIAANGYVFDENYLVSNHCDDVNIVLHIGAFTPKSGNDANNIKQSDSNIIGTHNLLSAANKIKTLEKIVFISTIDVFADTDEPISEATHTIPQTMYGWSKIYCEKMVTSFCKQNALHFNILRLGHVYGEGEEKYRKVMPVMIKNAINQQNITIFGDGEAIRTFIYIKDVANAIINSLEYNSSEIINIVGNESVTINELANIIVNLSGNDISIDHIKSDVPNRDLCFDNRKLMGSLLKTLTPLRDGLNNEINYMKKLGLK